jgi:acetolactate synthase-1/2/3 large subunit
VKLDGAEAAAKAMKESGVDHFFYVMGGMMIYDAIENEGIRTILCRNEKSATNMADGYARVTKKPTVCYGQHGAAAAILASMLYEPWFAHSPVIALTASYPILKRDQWSYQEMYEMKYFDQLCKFNVDCTDVRMLPYYIRVAIQMAVSGCPGVAHVNFPTNLSRETEEMPEIYGDKTFLTLPPFRPRPERARLAEAAKLLAASERPVMVCGTGVHWSGAYDEVLELAEMLSIPVTTNYGGKGCFPENHPLYAGVMGTYGRPVANDIVRESDLVFLVATRAGRMQMEEFTSPVPDTCKIIHLDIEPIAIGRVYKPDVALVGDAKATLQELNAISMKMIKKSKGERLKEIAKRVKEFELSIKELHSDEVPIMPQRIMTEVSKFITPRDIVVSDTGNMLSWTTRYVKLKGTGRNFLPVGGTLGSSFCLAIGASFGAATDQRVIHLTGDGGMGYNLVDLETAIRYNDLHVPMVTIVNNNAVLGSPRFPFTPIDYAKIFEAFGGFGIQVEKPGEIMDALKQALDSGKPACVDCVTDKNERAGSRVGSYL